MNELMNEVALSQSVSQSDRQTLARESGVVVVLLLRSSPPVDCVAKGRSVLCVALRCNALQVLSKLTFA